MRIFSKQLLSFCAGALSVMIVIYSATLLVAPRYADAALLPVCTATGSCRVCDIVSVFVTLGKWLISGAAGLALVVIVYGAIQLVISAGNAERVNSGKKQMVGAVVGLVITMTAFQLVTFLLLVLTTPSTSQNLADAEQGSLTGFLGIPWWQVCDHDTLIEKGGTGTTEKSTNNCAFWGDGTPCNKKGGVCARVKKVRETPGSGSQDLIRWEDTIVRCVNTTEEALGPTGNTIKFNNACDYLRQASPTHYGEYECQDINTCDPSTIERGLCPGGNNNVCCRKN